MKTLTSSILVALTLVGANVYAADNSTGVSRDQVRAELAQAKANGWKFNDATYPGPIAETSNVSRAQVKAELQQANANGQAFNDASYPGPVAETSDVSRAQVKAELNQAKASGWAFNDATYPDAQNVAGVDTQQTNQVASTTNGTPSL